MKKALKEIKSYWTATAAIPTEILDLPGFDCTREELLGILSALKNEEADFPLFQPGAFCWLTVSRKDPVDGRIIHGYLIFRTPLLHQFTMQNAKDSVTHKNPVFRKFLQKVSSTLPDSDESFRSEDDLDNPVPAMVYTLSAPDELQLLHFHGGGLFSRFFVRCSMTAKRLFTFRR